VRIVTGAPPMPSTRSVDRELLVLVGQVAVLQEQELGAVQADADGAAAARERDVGRGLGVRQQRDLGAVAGAGRRVRELGKAAALGERLALPGAVAGEVLRGRVHDRLAALGVEQDQVLVVKAGERVAGAHQHRQAEAAGQDRAVRIRAAGTGDHAQQPGAGELGHVRRGDRVGDQDLAHARGELAFFRRGAALQRADHAVQHLLDVLAPAAQVGVVHRAEDRRHLLALFLQRGVGAVAPDMHQVVQPAQQVGIVQQQAVRVDEFADLARQRPVHAPAQLAQFLARGVQRRVQALQFGLDLVIAKRACIDLEAAGLDQPCPPQRHAARRLRSR